MTNLISRQAAIDAVADLYWMDERLLNFKKEIDATFDKIKALPSAQPEPKRGKWTNDGKAYALYQCSACNEFCTVAGYANCIPEERMYKTMKYCPNCGAKMERSVE